MDTVFILSLFTSGLLRDRISSLPEVEMLIRVMVSAAKKGDSILGPSQTHWPIPESIGLTLYQRALKIPKYQLNKYKKNIKMKKDHVRDWAGGIAQW